MLSRYAWFTVAMLFVTAAPLLADDLRTELRELRRLRNGSNTPFAAVEEKAEKLLSRYTAANDRGQILYELARIYAQSGQVRPERTGDYASKALACPLDVPKRLQLYVYWGDAIQVEKAKSKTDWSAKRKSAAGRYLQGFREALNQGLPDKAPDLPDVFPYTVSVDIPGSDVHERFKRKHEEAMAARKVAEAQSEMISLRDMLARQVADLYGRPPFATDELRTLAKETLKDDAAVERLVTQVKARAAETEKRLAAALAKANEQLRQEAAAKAKAKDTEPRQPDPSDQGSTSAAWRFWLALAGGGLLVLGVVFAWLKARANRTAR